MNPETARRSCLYSPGATNSHTWYSTNGIASTTPRYKPMLMTSVKYPAGEVKYSLSSKCAARSASCIGFTRITMKCLETSSPIPAPTAIAAAE